MFPCIPASAPDAGTTAAVVCVVAEPLAPPPPPPQMEIRAADLAKTRLVLADPLAALLACGSTVAPSTLKAIIRVESGSQSLAINVNGVRDQPAPARSASEATATAEHWIARGYSVDLGFMQVNSRNLHALGYSVAQMFDACTNVRAGASILTADYLAALTSRSDPQLALQAALSAYNTGSFDRGFFNGYVAKYYGPRAIDAQAPTIIGASLRSAQPSAPLNPYTANPTIYTRKEASND